MVNNSPRGHESCRNNENKGYKSEEKRDPRKRKEKEKRTLVPVNMISVSCSV